MKVVQINTVYESSSTGRTTKELHEALLKRGIDSFVVFGVGKKTNNPLIYRTQTRIGYIINNFFARLLGLEGFLAQLSTRKIIKILKKINPDIVHLRNLHGHYINLPLLFSYLNKSTCKVVMSLHDLWMLTGSCPSPYLHNCEKWKERCFDCPAKREYPESWFFDFSKKNHFRKRECLLSIKDKLTLVGVSQWTMKMAESSNLNLKITYIYNWINLDLFFPRLINKNSSKIELLCVASIWEKGSKKLNDLIAIANSLPAKYHITVVGYHNFKSHEFLPSNISLVPPLDTEGLALLYSKSDLFLHLSHSDTFGKVIAESLACGTPVVAFDITAMSEMIVDGCGSKIKPFDLNEFIKIIETYGKKDEKTILRCRKSCSNRFSFRNIDKTIKLYMELLNGN